MERMELSSVCGSAGELNQGECVSGRAGGRWCVQTPTAVTSPNPAVLPPPQDNKLPILWTLHGNCEKLAWRDTVQSELWVPREDSCMSHPELSFAAHFSRILWETRPSRSSPQTCVCREGACMQRKQLEGHHLSIHLTQLWAECFHFIFFLIFLQRSLKSSLLSPPFAVTSIRCLTFLGCKLFKMLSAPVQCLAQSFLSGQWGI